MARICHSCGKRPAFGQSRSHSMVATKRRFDVNVQKVRIVESGRSEARLRLHALPQGGQGHEGLAGGRGTPWPIRASSASASSSRLLSRSLNRGGEEVNDLNVFPVADGDTGDNMALTLRAVLHRARQPLHAGRDRRDRPRPDRRLRRPRGAARRARQLRRHPEPADPRRRRGADLAARASWSTRCWSPPPWRAPPTARTARCATPPRARSSRSCARWPRAPRVRSRTWPSRACSTASTTRRRTRCSPTCSSTRWTPARRPSSAAPSCCRSCARRASWTPAATA